MTASRMRIMGLTKPQTTIKQTTDVTTASEQSEVIIPDLANEPIAIAESILKYSTVLSEHVLLTIIKGNVTEHINMICQREQLSETVTDALLHSNSGDAALWITKNKQASISASGFDLLIEHASEDKNIRTALLARNDRPDDSFDRVKESISYKLKQDILAAQPNLSDEEADDIAFIQADKTLKADREPINKDVKQELIAQTSNIKQQSGFFEKETSDKRGHISKVFDATTATNSLFIALKEFNDFSQSTYEETLVQAGLDHESYLVLQNLPAKETINLLPLLTVTGLTYRVLITLLNTLENKQLITQLGATNDPETLRYALTDAGNILLEKSHQKVVAAEKHILNALPQSATQLKHILSSNITLNHASKPDKKAMNDDLSVDEKDQKAISPLDDFKLVSDKATSVETDKIRKQALISKTEIKHSKSDDFNTENNHQQKALKPHTLLSTVSQKPLDMVSLPAGLLNEAVLSSKPSVSLSNTSTKVHLAKLKQLAETALFTNQGIISLKEVMKLTFGKEFDVIGSTKIQHLVEDLATINLGLSPDPKFAFKQQEFDDQAVLFRLPQTATTKAKNKVSKNFHTAYLMLHLGMKAAQSDDKIVEVETDIIEKIVLKNPELSKTDKMRLQADMVRLSHSKISLDYIASMLSDLSPKHKENMAHLAFRVVASDDIIETSELNFLLWLYEQLHFSHDQIKQKVEMIRDLPKNVAKNYPEQLLIDILGYPNNTKAISEEKDTQNETAPKSPTKIHVVSSLKTVSTDQEGLDENHIASLREESENSLLHEIFEESLDREDDEDFGYSYLFDDIQDANILKENKSNSLDNKNAEATVNIAGLDKDHQALLLSLLDKENIDWSWFEHRARECQLMGKGAVETLNEWGYDLYNEAVIEYDPFWVNKDFYTDIIDIVEASPENTNNADELCKAPSPQSPTSNEATAEPKAEPAEIIEKQPVRITFDSSKRQQFLEEVLAEKEMNQERFGAIAAAYGLSYDDAFDLLQ